MAKHKGRLNSVQTSVQAHGAVPSLTIYGSLSYRCLWQAIGNEVRPVCEAIPFNLPAIISRKRDHVFRATISF